MIKNFVSYAQEFEDWILYCALEDVQNGFYVDVGASDPCVISVTKAFYDMGWNGINIEPLDDEYKKMCSDRPRDINLNIGVGSENTSLEFFIAGVGTTCVPETTRRFKNIDTIKKKMIAVRRLSDVLDEYLKEKDKAIHFCKIDVEGFERSVLEGMDFDKFRPWIIVIEATLPGTCIPCHDKWEDLLFDSKYELGFAYGINRYYFDKLLDGERIEKIKSGFAAVWDKAAALFPESWIDKDIIIWGVSRYAHSANHTLKEFKKSPLRYWDKTPHDAIDGVEVVYPELETASKELKENVVILMAFTLDKNIEECSLILEKNGFKHFFAVKQFLRYLYFCGKRPQTSNRNEGK